MTSTEVFLTHLQNKKIALVYDWVDSWGGAERLLLTLHEMFPHAHWYTSYVNPHSSSWAHELQLQTSWMQNVPLILKSKILAAPLFPLAFESFNFDGYDAVISITSSYAKGIITKPETPHVCIMLTPTRYLWVKQTEYIGPMGRWIMHPYISYLKEWDTVASQRPDHIIAISQTVAKRIKDIYNRTSTVIYPPFDVNYWEETMRNMKPPSIDTSKAYYLLVSRLRPYKKVDLAIEAFNNMPDKRLIIVGSGSKHEHKRLQRMAQDNTTFISDISDQELAYLYGHAQALVMPQEEDFGYTALEALACGCAVVAYAKGGITETIKHGQTGYLFEEQNVASIVDALEKFSSISYTIERYLQLNSRTKVEAFDTRMFVSQFTSHIHSILNT